jgi:hypothetical protein
MFQYLHGLSIGQNSNHVYHHIKIHEPVREKLLRESLLLPILPLESSHHRKKMTIRTTTNRIAQMKK